MNKYKCSCISCKKELDSCNLLNHHGSKSCNYNRSGCLFCGKECKRKFCSTTCAGKYQHKFTRVGKKIDTSNKNIIYCSCLLCKRNITARHLESHKCKTKRIPKSIHDTPRSLYSYNCRFRFSITQYKEWFSYASSLIKENGWYSSKENVKGCQRDHMLSISDGFRNSIDPKIISHPANCKIMVSSENQSKHSKSSISLNDLMERIKRFEEIYGDQRR